MQGINWKALAATLTSALTILAVIPYQLGDLGTVIPPKYKGWIVVLGLVATTLLRSINAVKPPEPK